MQSKNTVPTAVIKRLPRYHRYLGDLLWDGVTKISSGALSKKMRVTASQIRQDLNHFGGFGQQGYGYNVESLYHEISSILGADQDYGAILVGAGNLGQAITWNVNFAKRGVRLLALFDIDPEKVGTVVGDCTVYHMDELETFVSAHKPAIAILTLPKAATSDVADRLHKLGVRGLWNFSNMELAASDRYRVENVHLGDSLMTLCYSLKTSEEE